MERNKTGVRNRLHSIMTIIKHGMFWHGVRNNIARLGVDIMPYYWSMTSSQSVTEPILEMSDPDLEWSIFGESEIDFVKNNIIGIENKDLLDYLKDGETCIGLKNKDEIMGFLFLRTKSFEFRNRHFELGEHDYYLHSLYVFEKYRGKNIASYLRYHGVKLMKKENRTHLYSISEYFNKSAVKHQRKSNAQPLKIYLSVVLFRRKTMNFTIKNHLKQTI